MQLSDFVPPIAVSVVRRLLPVANRRAYADYAEALKGCSEQGNENDALVNIVVEKTRRYRELLGIENAPIGISTSNAFGLCALLSASGQRQINVLDFGGAAGAHYFLARAVVQPSCRLRCIVIETPAMGEMGRPLFSNEDLNLGQTAH